MKALDKIMVLEKAKNVPALAVCLGVSKATIDTWKSRGKVPEGVLREWEIKHDKPRGWFTEDETKKADYSPIVEAIIGKVEGLTDAQKGEAYALLSKHFSDELKRDRP